MINRVLFSLFLAFAIVAGASCVIGFDPEPILNGLDFALLPLTLVGVAAGLVTIKALWRPCMEELGYQYFLTVRYVQQESGKSVDARDLWVSCESIRVLKTGMASQVLGAFVVSASSDYTVTKIGRREYLMIVEVKDMTGRDRKSLFED